MQRLLPLILSLVLTPLAIFGQRDIDNYRIHVSSSPIIIENDLATNWESLKVDSETIYNNTVYALVQLNSIPTNDEKEALNSGGIELLSYVPNFAWIAKVDPTLTSTQLSSLDVRNITKISANWKMSTEMNDGVIPDFAGTKENISVRVLFWKDSEEVDYASIVSEYSDGSPKLITPSRVELAASLEDLKLLVNHPLVQYIEFTGEPTIDEGILDESMRIISTYVSDNPGKGYYFDGSGVKIGVEESNMVDTLQNPNFRSRIDRSSETGTTANGHKTGVALRMGGAGNINPKDRGTAFGADVHSGGFNFAAAAADTVTIINRSVGWGCSSNSETYSSSSENYDVLIRTNPTFMITHSAGNVGGSECYAGSEGWGNITGLPKMAKNIFAVGSSGTDGTLTGFSSRGPAKDGRILPSIVAPGGGGTSHATPNLAGVYGQLNQAYRFHNGGVVPNSGLLKAVILNTADDMLNPGPDFKTGYGHVNARRAYEVVRQGQFLTSSVSQGTDNTHTISVPSNVKEVKVMVYWVDWEATPGIVTRSIVNDIDIELEDPNALVYQPWVLNPTFDSITLNDFAVRATDTLNNSEQVTIDNPISGNYQLTVSGSLIPQGPQEYFMTYEFVYDEIFVTHPHGGEKLVPNETERIRWDACDSNTTFDLSYSLDDGASWSSISTAVAASDRYYDWDVPSAITDLALIRVERGGTVGVSDTTFSILAQPENLELVWSCADSSLFIWDEFPSADGYVAYRIVGDYMDSVGFSSTNSIVLNGLSLSEMEYVSIAAMQNGVVSRRIIAIERPATDLNCVLDNLGALELVNPGIEVLPSCMTGSNSDITIVIRNWGVNAVDSIPVALRLNGGFTFYDTVFTSIPTGGDYTLTFDPSPSLPIGTNLLEIWTEYYLDSDFTNDTIAQLIDVYSSVSGGPTISEDFDNFTNCSTAWDCELVNCAMQNGWYNLPNGIGDDIDWRTDNNGTGTANTGPSGDHTSGTGRYLYLEGSGPCTNSTARLYSPCIDMTGINQATLSFWYHAYGTAIGELHVDVVADGILVEDIMTPVIGNQGDQWTNEQVDLSQFTNQNIVVVIRGSTGGGYHSDLAIDDINITNSPIASFQSVETQLCESDIITLDNYSVYGDTYDWSFTPNTVTYEGGTNNTSTVPQVSFNDPGYYTIQLITTNAFGSDTSILTDYIYVWDPSTTITAESAYCEGDSVVVYANNNGVEVDYYLNGTIEDSNVDPSYYYANADDGDTLFVAYTVNGGCMYYSDSVIISIGEVDAGITQNGISLSADASGAQYQWINCENGNTIIPNETNQDYLAIVDGEFAVIVTENGCTDTSECVIVNTFSIDENGIEGLSFYPNPTTGEFTIEFSQNQANVDIVVRNVLGQKVSETSASNMQSVELELKGETGVYFVEVESGDRKSVLRIVKKD